MRIKNRKSLIAIIVVLVIAIIALLVVKNKNLYDNECSQYAPDSMDNCPTGCRICPSCETCNSLRCNPIKFCDKIGFDEKWFEQNQAALKNLKSESEKLN